MYTDATCGYCSGCTLNCDGACCGTATGTCEATCLNNTQFLAWAFKNSCPSTMYIDNSTYYRVRPHAGFWTCAPLAVCNTTTSFVSREATVTSNRVCTSLVNCTGATPYQDVAPTATSGRTCTAQPTCPVGWWSPILPSSTSSVQCNSAVTACGASTPYTVAQPTFTSDRRCAKACQRWQYVNHTSGAAGTCINIANCTGAAPYQQHGPSQTSNRVCTASCGPDTYIARSQNPTSALGNCTNLTVCNPATQFQNKEPTPNTDRGCGYLTNCTLGQTYQGVTPTATTDRSCWRITNCTQIGMYSLVPPTLTSDVVCNQSLTHCVGAVTIRATLTSDRKCNSTGVPLAARREGLGSDAIIGLALGCAVLVSMIVAAGWMWRRSRHKVAAVTVEMSELLEANAAGQAAMEKMKEAWRIPEHHLSFLHKIAEGSFGTVWRGLWGAQAVAIKVLHSVDIDEGKYFEKECETLQAIKHPNLLVFFGAGRTADRAYLVTEFMGGGSLLAFLQDRLKPLAWQTRVKIAYQVACGMQHLHRLEIVHRDLKSDNVLLDYEQNAKVADFGESRAVCQRQAMLRRQGTVLDGGSMDMTKAVGTPLWMAPEVFFGTTEYGPEIDVYSFGIVMWELATREIPWSELGTTCPDFLSQYTALQEIHSEGRRPELPIDFESQHPEYTATMQRCWAADQSARPSFDEVVLTLGQIEGAPSQQGPTVGQSFLSVSLGASDSSGPGQWHSSTGRNNSASSPEVEKAFFHNTTNPTKALYE